MNIILFREYSGGYDPVVESRRVCLNCRSQQRGVPGRRFGKNCQFGDLGRNALRGPDFLWSDFYLTKWFRLSERLKLRVEAQAFNVFNHPNFALPSNVYAGIPGERATQTGFGALTSTTAPPTGLLGVGLGGIAHRGWWHSRLDWNSKISFSLTA